MADNRNDTTIGDVLRDHFGVTNIREARERRNDTLEKERIEQMNVAMGNAPSARNQAQAVPVPTVNPVGTVPLPKKARQTASARPAAELLLMIRQQADWSVISAVHAFRSIPCRSHRVLDTLFRI